MRLFYKKLAGFVGQLQIVFILMIKMKLFRVENIFNSENSYAIFINKIREEERGKVSF